MKTQAIFDKVVKHLLTQNKKSKSNGQCMYLSSDGLKCAIGCLINKKEYSKKMEGRNVEMLLRSYASLRKKIIASNKNYSKILHLLFHLQEIHDYCHAKQWSFKLEEMSRKFNLKFNPPKSLIKTKKNSSKKVNK
jgi:hypothetical protein